MGDREAGRGGAGPAGPLPAELTAASAEPILSHPVPPLGGGGFVGGVAAAGQGRGR